MTASEFKYMTEAMSVDLAELLSTDLGMDIETALDTLYNSTTYARLTDPATGLSFQSSGYVYSFLKNEVMTGKIA